MATVFEFSPAAIPQRRHVNLDEATRATLTALVNDLQILAIDHPASLQILARQARRLVVAHRAPVPSVGELFRDDDQDERQS